MGGVAARLADEPAGREAEAAGPTTSDGLEDKGSEEEPHAGTTGRGVVEEGLARLHMLEHRAWVPVGSGPDGGAEGTADGEVPGLVADLRGRGGPRCQRGGRGPGQKGRVGQAEGEDSPSSGARGGRRPGFSVIAGDVVEDVTNGVVTANAVCST